MSDVKQPWHLAMASYKVALNETSSLMEKETKFDLKELHEAEEKNGRKFDFVRMSLADLNGISRTSVVPRKHLENYLLNGLSTYSGRWQWNL